MQCTVSKTVGILGMPGWKMLVYPATSVDKQLFFMASQKSSYWIQLLLFVGLFWQILMCFWMLLELPWQEQLLACKCAAVGQVLLCSNICCRLWNTYQLAVCQLMDLAIHTPVPYGSVSWAFFKEKSVFYERDQHFCVSCGYSSVVWASEK